jgi:hypothetical protein
MVSQATRATGNTQVIAVADPVAMAKAAADRVIAAMVANGGRIAICLSGGSSPKRLYELLATEPYRSRIPWDRVHWFIGDERFVGPDDARNNMSMARHAFLDACAPTGAVHPIPIDTANPDEAAQEYERELKLFYGSETLDPARPLFDVVMLGVGARILPRNAIPGERRWKAVHPNPCMGRREPARPASVHYEPDGLASGYRSVAGEFPCVTRAPCHVR